MVLMCGHIVSVHGAIRSKGKDWQYCEECPEGPILREVIADEDFKRHRVSRGTSKGWDVPSEPLF